MKIRIVFIILFNSILGSIYAQFIKDGIRPAYVENGDTIYVEFLNEVEVFAPLVFDSKKNAKRWSRLVIYVKKVYPYAKIAGMKMREYQTVLDSTEKQKDKRKIMKQVEADLKFEFEEDLKQLTYMQGEILLKLIDRETQNSSYDLVKDLRGGFKATFYQGFARLFGFDLKERYDPQGRDREIENIVLLIEQGKI